MTTREGRFIAVTENIQEAGATVWFELRDGTDLGRLAKAWISAGLDEKLLPSATTPRKALRRAAKKAQRSRKLARPLATRDGWALVAEQAEGENLDYTVEARVRFDEDGVPFVEPAGHPKAAEVLGRYYAEIGAIASRDVSKWLVGLLAKLDAVPLRDAGALYFVPRHRLPEWQAIVAVLRASTENKVRQMPTLRSDEAVEAIIAAVERDARDAAKEIEDELSTGELGTRAIGTRKERAEAIAEKVRHYEDLLGTSLDTLRGRLQTLDAKIATAALASGGEDFAKSLDIFLPIGFDPSAAEQTSDASEAA